MARKRQKQKSARETANDSVQEASMETSAGSPADGTYGGGGDVAEESLRDVPTGGSATGAGRGDAQGAGSANEAGPASEGRPTSEAGPASEEGGAAGEEPSLEQQVQEAREQAARALDQALRARAELDNVQKRSQRALEDRARYAAEPLARDLLPAVDDLERALEHASSDASGIIEGVELVLNSLVAALEKHGVSRVASVGEPFDPAVHEAVGMMETDAVPDGAVAAQHRAGYRIHDRLLRAAMVAVAKAPG